jgi:hypothetical protein
MPEFIIFMHSDSASEESEADWGMYIEKLNSSGGFRGGSTIGSGNAYRLGRSTVLASSQVNGFIRVKAESIADAEKFLEGNPTFHAGGTVEIRQLIESG